MLVIEKAQSIAVKADNPNRILNCIPSAKTINVRGNDMIVTPHKIDEVKVLRNLGIKAPSPILHYYNWSGRFIPYHHQKMTSAFLTMNQHALVLNEIGTGKTQSALWAADYLMQSKTIQRCLIVSPLSTLERVWDDAIFMNFPHRKSVILHGTASKRIKLLQTNADFFIVNHDGFNIIADTAKDIFDLVIVDEVAKYALVGVDQVPEFIADDVIYPIEVPSLPLYILLAACNSNPFELPLVIITDHQSLFKNGRYILAELLAVDVFGIHFKLAYW